MVHERGITEANLEYVTLAWFESLDYLVVYGPDISPGSPVYERQDYDRVILVDRLRTALESISPNPPMQSTKPSGKSHAQSRPAGSRTTGASISYPYMALMSHIWRTIARCMAKSDSWISMIRTTMIGLPPTGLQSPRTAGTAVRTL
ncbi:MAG TPA: hypothetical protein ENF23_05600 [Methanosarcinales archaeon]|nr:hypothetical protein [Methanosarcinales archaeon]